MRVFTEWQMRRNAEIRTKRFAKEKAGTTC
jgi:hypothetical protein